MTLLAPDEPNPVEILHPHGASDLVLIADHAGRRIPRALGTLGLDEIERGRHIAWDIGIAGVTRMLAGLLDAATVMQRYSRLVIDCNRPAGVPSSIPKISESTVIPGNADVDETEASARRTEIMEPYHAAIEALLDERAAAGRRTVLIAMHSFTPTYMGVSRPWDIGLLHLRDKRLATPFLAVLRAEGDLVVGDNEPYQATDESDYAIPIHGERRGLVHVGIEIRQDLIAEPPGQEAWARRLARLLPLAAA
jgi:predicted N-formylglutamate amidohydrolase